MAGAGRGPTTRTTCSPRVGGARRSRARPIAAEASLEGEEATLFTREAKRRRTLAIHLRERDLATRAAPGAAGPPTTVSVSGLIEYAGCPKRFYWSAIRPLPRFSGPAARIGTRVHAWIERRSIGQATLLELDEPPDLAPEELTGEPGKVARLREVFMASRFTASSRSTPSGRSCSRSTDTW